MVGTWQSSPWSSVSRGEPFQSPVAQRKQPVCSWSWFQDLSAPEGYQLAGLVQVGCGSWQCWGLSPGSIPRWASLPCHHHGAMHSPGHCLQLPLRPSSSEPPCLVSAALCLPVLETAGIHPSPCAAFGVLSPILALPSLWIYL